jgi:glutathione synthase/RimK-type ligase-like ATP-grasp enzyme
MGLRISGVDIMVTKGDITKDPKNCSYYIIEINSALGIEPVESTYLKILKALGKKD